MTLVTTDERRVRNGMQVLDERFPRWREKVKPWQLNLESGNSCVLGQVFGAYGAGCVKLGIEGQSKQAIELGFYTRDGADYEQLTTVWRDLLDDELATSA